jgi:DNA polymerase-3 subunit delta'
MNQLPWLQDKTNQWIDLVMSNQVPHAVLLSGSKGLGKLELAQIMAQLALCESISVKGFCNKCVACELYKVNNHPDIKLIKAEKTIIKVEQIRQLSRNITLSPTRNQHRVVIIENAEQMNKAAANAILKTLEEPPKKVVIILTTSEMGRLLPTIKSRCIKLNIAAPPINDSMDWLISQSTYSHNEIALALTLANNSPLTASQLLQYDILNAIKVMLSDLNLLSQGVKTVLEIAKSWQENELELNLPYLATYFLSLIKSNKSMNSQNKILTIMNLNQYEDVVDLDSKLLKFVKHLYQFMKYSQTPLKKELLLEELLIKWQIDFKNGNQY